MEYFTEFLNNVINHADFPELKKCIELIMNVKNYYSNKDINEIKGDLKEVKNATGTETKKLNPNKKPSAADAFKKN